MQMRGCGFYVTIKPYSEELPDMARVFGQHPCFENAEMWVESAGGEGPGGVRVNTDSFPSRQ